MGVGLFVLAFAISVFICWGVVWPYYCLREREETERAHYDLEIVCVCVCVNI